MDLSGLRRDKPTIDVVSPFPDVRSGVQPRWFERLRGLLGIAGLVLVAGFAAAILVALALLALAIFVATAFN